MPTATLTFKLPEESEEFHTIQQAGNYHSALCEMSTLFRAKVKYENNPKTTWEEVRNAFIEILNQRNIEL